MINYIEKGYWLHDEIIAQGHYLNDIDGQWKSDDDIAVQSIIDTFDPLPYAKKEAIKAVNNAAGNARLRYVTNIPSQNATYQLKLNDANSFKTAGYPEADLAKYPFIDAESNALGSTGKVAADLIISTASQWIAIAANIEGVRRAAIDKIEAENDWKKCATLAESFINTLNTI